VKVGGSGVCLRLSLNDETGVDTEEVALVNACMETLIAAAVSGGSFHLLNLKANGVPAVDHYNAEQPTGQVGSDFSKGGLVHHGGSWYPSNLRMRLCFVTP
jgi:hypothetical protein